MADVVDKATRSRMMAGIRAKNTAPELQIRSLLHRAGFRYRLHASELPGKPDLVLPKYGAVIFVHGCFWHQHNCSVFKWPRTNAAFWRKKITDNRKRDRKHLTILLGMGWRVLTIWECALRGIEPPEGQRLFKRVARWLKSEVSELSVPTGAGT